MKSSPFYEKTQAFIKYASSELGSEVRWLHRHLNDFDGTADTPIDESSLFEALRAIMESNHWNPEHQALHVVVSIQDADGIQLDFPATWRDVFAQNHMSGEPPSINLIHTPHLRDRIRNWPTFSTGILSGNLLDSLIHAGIHGFHLRYLTSPYEYLTTPYEGDGIDGMWGRTIQLSWIGEVD